MSFLVLTMLEIILGIDNIIFIALVVNKIKVRLRRVATAIGLSFALAMRVSMLLTLSWVMNMTNPVFSILDHDFSYKDLLLIAGAGYHM
jgi:predicted tellurium resistance membrane protein TerC